MNKSILRHLERESIKIYNEIEKNWGLLVLRKKEGASEEDKNPIAQNHGENPRNPRKRGRRWNTRTNDEDRLVVNSFKREKKEDELLHCSTPRVRVRSPRAI